MYLFLNRSIKQECIYDQILKKIQKMYLFLNSSIQQACIYDQIKKGKKKIKRCTSFLTGSSFSDRINSIWQGDDI